MSTKVENDEKESINDEEGKLDGKPIKYLIVRIFSGKYGTCRK
jgi:hypothetical protein